MRGFALVVAGFLTAPIAAIGAPLVRAADIYVAFEPASICDVTMRLTIDGASEMDHRLDAPDGSSVELIGVGQATPIGAVARRGRTASLVLRLESPHYEIRYRARQVPSDDERCPLWVPMAATDGRSRDIHIDVELPPNTGPGTTLPAFSWTGPRGAARLGHIPAFVRVARVPAGARAGWTVGQWMDAATIGTFVVASALWLWRRRRARWA